ncbi:DUF998 domain-containing protein [Spirillospora sp. CA-108201]
MPRDPRPRLLLLAGLAPALYTAVLLLDGLTRPGYDPLHHFGSELADGDRGRLMIGNFVAAGALTMCFAFGLRNVPNPGRGHPRRRWPSARSGSARWWPGCSPPTPSPAVPWEVPEPRTPACTAWSTTRTCSRPGP